MYLLSAHETKRRGERGGHMRGIGGISYINSIDACLCVIKSEREDNEAPCL